MVPISLLRLWTAALSVLLRSAKDVAARRRSGEKLANRSGGALNSVPFCASSSKELRQWARMRQLFLLLVFLPAVVLSGQAQSAPSAAPHNDLTPADAGLETPEEARAIVTGVLKTNDQLKPVLASLNPQAWYEKKGAPSSYVVQWQSAQQHVNDVNTAGKFFLQHVDRIDTAMDLYFRLEALEFSSRALNEGAQRYADRPVAEQLATFVARNFDSRQRFREYLKDLASSVEQNYKIADEEAQRCRALVSKGSASPCISTAPRKHGS